MINSLYRGYAYLLMLPLLIFFASNSYSQGWDNPNVDQVPNSVIQSYVPTPMNADVITIDGFDNFNIGTDFAEPHMSVNPMNPLEYFNAFNTNATHYSYNGVDWFYQFPVFGVEARPSLLEAR